MVVLAGIAAACLQPQLQPAYSQPSADSPLKAAAAVGESVSLSLGPLDALARRDPLALLELASARCSLEIGDYQCIMLKQEKLAGRLTPVQRIRMRYRATPHSVYLEWLENAGQAKRACYVTGRDMGQDGCELARIEPAGCIVQLFTREVTIPVNGQQARASSLQTMDKAGYAGTFRSLADVHHAAQRRGDLDVRYRGTGVVDGRPTYVLERHLPYPDRASEYPNGCLVLHLDQQWLLPVGIYTYADAEQRELIGSYTMVDVHVNVGFESADFEL
jgi:hypothetical protein